MWHRTDAICGRRTFFAPRSPGAMTDNRPIQTPSDWIAASAALLGLMAVLAGCVGGSGGRGVGRHADAWRLAGPFTRSPAADSTADPNETRADRPPSSGAQPAANAAQARPHPPASGNLPDSRPAQPSSNPSWLATTDVEPESHVHADEEFWYLDFGLRTSFPRLAWTKRQLARRLQLPLRLDFLGLLGSTTTALDRRRDLSIHTLRLGLGRQENDWFKWNVYAGGGVWKDRTHQRVLTANLKVSFDYKIAYAGITANLYPFATPKYGRYASRWEHIKAARPYVLAGVEVTYVNAEGRGRYGYAPFTLYSDHEKVRDWLVSGLIGLGWEIPLDSRWALDLSGHYAFHFYRPEEFNGWATQIGLRYRF